METTAWPKSRFFHASCVNAEVYSISISVLRKQNVVSPITWVNFKVTEM